MAQTRVMRDVDGNTYDIPFAEVEKAQKGGLYLTVPMVNQKGDVYDIPEYEAPAAKASGLKPVSFAQSPSEVSKEEVRSVMEKYPTAAKVARGVGDIFSPVAAGLESAVGLVNPERASVLREERLRKARQFDELPGGGMSLARTAGQVGAVVAPAVIAAPATVGRALMATPAAGRAALAYGARAAKAGISRVGELLAAGVAGYAGAKALGEAEKATTEITK